MIKQKKLAIFLLNDLNLNYYEKINVTTNLYAACFIFNKFTLFSTSYKNTCVFDRVLLKKKMF